MATDRLLVEKRNIRKEVLIYTLLFVVTALGSYCFYILGHNTFLNAALEGNKDGAAQILPSYVAVKHIVQGILAGKGFSAWNWSIGLGQDNWNIFATKLSNPFTYLIIAVPEKYIDISYTVVAVFKQYCVGLAFLFFGRKVGLDAKQNVMGAMCYAFSMWVYITATAQSGFDTAAILLPLIILGIEKLIDCESPLLFVLSVFFAVTSGATWAYALGVITVIYYIAKALCEKEFRTSEDFWKTTGRFLLCGITGILLSASFVAYILMSMTGATTDTGSGKEAMFTLRAYITAPIALYKASTTGAASYSAIGLPVLGVMLMPMVIKGVKDRKPEAIIAIACLIGSQIPFVCRFFNGFSYPSGRWMFILAFFMSWATMEFLNEETFQSKKNVLIMEGWLFVTVGWILGQYVLMESTIKKTPFTAGMGLFFGSMLILLCYIKANDGLKDGGLVRLIRKCFVVLFIGIVCIDIMEIYTIDSLNTEGDGVDGYSVVGEVYEQIEKDPERAVATLEEEDTDFYRSDQVGGYYGNRTIGARVNENIMRDTRSIYSYFSTVQSTWHEYNKAVGNATGNYRRTLIVGNDNRAMLDYLMGVKYFVGSPVGEDKSGNSASNYLPYGYEYYKDIDGYEIYRNKYCMGLGTVYNQYITETEFYEYPLVEREQVLMQAAVVPDDWAERINGVKHAKKSDIQTAASEIEYELKADSDGIDMDLENGKLTVTDPTASMTMTLPEIRNSQIIVSFENLNRKENTYDEYCVLTGGEAQDKSEDSFKERVERLSFSDDQGYKITLNTGKSKKCAKCEKSGVRSFNDVDDYDINLGYYDSFSGELTLNISNYGYYDFDSIKVYAIPMDTYAKAASALDEASYKIDSWSDDYIDGSVDAKSDGVMYFSILSTKGWHIYIDGEKAEKINDVNISFTGAAIEKGVHRVELKYEYPYKNIIIIITIIGIILLAVELFAYKRRR